MTKDEYQRYLRSRHWRVFKNKIYQKRKVCEDCGKGYDLDLHHLTYSRVGFEQESDLLLLCRADHYRRHRNAKGFRYLKPSDIFEIIGTWFRRNYAIPYRR